jgi:hypothetical protein
LRASFSITGFSINSIGAGQEYTVLIVYPPAMIPISKTPLIFIENITIMEEKKARFFWAIE